MTFFMKQFSMVGIILLLTCLFTATFSAPTLPGPPINMNLLKFYYFPTPESHVEIIFNNNTSLEASNLKPATKTYVLLDGFTSNLTSYMNNQTKNAFAALPEANLILIDWSSYNGYPVNFEDFNDIIYAYVTALLHMPRAGDHLAKFFNFLRIQKQIEFSNITILSHSLGCHAAGTTGRAVKRLYNNSIGRIVGLDPSLQFFELETKVRLQIGDASTVEIYQTSRQTYGENYPATGDITIYPNGGEDQPCEVIGAPGSTGCNSHSYSWKLYNYALTNQTIKACPCKGASCFCKNCNFDCGNNGITIGPFIQETARGSYYVKTGYLEWD